MGANTFPLRNQSLALESLKDQLGFLVTIILGGDSLLHKKQRPRNQPMVAATPRSAREGATGWRLHWGLRTRLGNLFVYAVLLVFVFLYE